jgi:AraC-like DNA-binding protein
MPRYAYGGTAASRPGMAAGTQACAQRAAKPQVSRVVFSTRDLPERERVPFWCEFFGRHVVRTQIEPVAQTNFDAQATLWSMPGLRAHWSHSSGARVRRPRKLISVDDHHIALLIDCMGTSIFSQAGHEVALERGGGVAVLQTESALMEFPRTRYMGVIAPVKALQPLVRSVEDKAGWHIPATNEALYLIRSYVEALKRGPDLSDRDVATLAAAHIHDLMALALGATRDGAALAHAGGLRAARLDAIKTHICDNLEMQGLSVQSVALHHGLTPRYVHMLFEGEGATFSTFVREKRLLRACNMLRSPRYAGHSISAIAFDAGFGDLSYFNRSFRRRFGASPTEIRLAGQLQH